MSVEPHILKGKVSGPLLIDLSTIVFPQQTSVQFTFKKRINTVHMYKNGKMIAFEASREGAEGGKKEKWWRE
jgi:hypothetical protein